MFLNCKLFNAKKNFIFKSPIQNNSINFVLFNCSIVIKHVLIFQTNNCSTESFIIHDNKTDYV